MSKISPLLLSRRDNVLARNYIVINAMLELGTKCLGSVVKERLV